MDERSWEGLLLTALAILDDLDARGLGAPEIAMGGGTALMMRMHHRLSRDVAPIGDFMKVVPSMIDSALALIGSAETGKGRPT